MVPEVHGMLARLRSRQRLKQRRDAEESGEDWGIHLEYDDRSNGDYGCVAACSLGPGLFREPCPPTRAAGRRYRVRRGPPARP